MAEAQPSSAAAQPPPGRTPEPHARTSLSIGFLAMLPMLAAYELARGHAGNGRNTCEFLLTLPLSSLGEYAQAARWAALAAAGLVALYVARARGVPILTGTARVVLEGCAGAVVLGPLLVGISWLLRDWLPDAHLAWTFPERPPGLAQAALLWGSGAWEELFFRVGLYSVMYLLCLRALQLFTAGLGPARLAAELFALVGSSLFFALFHLEWFTGWIGAGGEPFDAGVFTWRVLAGILLAILFRLRGAGVAAWTHGLFNLALLIGIGPDVLL